MSLELYGQKDGYPYAIVAQPMGFLCGYVAVDEDHPLFGCDYSEENNKYNKSPEELIDVHGGVTFSGDDLIDVSHKEKHWWFGFDCGHAGDGMAGYLSGISDGPMRSQEYVKKECFDMIRQFQELAKD